MHRPYGAYKLLATLLYGSADRIGSLEPQDAPLMRWISDRGGSHGSHLEIPSVRRLGRLLGAESKKVNAWLAWLYEQGLLENLQWSEDRRSVRVRLTRPRNV